MKLRTQLLPPVPDENKVQMLIRFVDEIERTTTIGSDEDFNKAIDKFNALAHEKLDKANADLSLFFEDAEAAAKKALTPRAPYIEYLEEDEQLEIIRMLREEDLEAYQWNYFYDLLRINLGMHYLPLDAGNPMQILNKAKAYKPIAL